MRGGGYLLLQNNFPMMRTLSNKRTSITSDCNIPGIYNYFVAAANLWIFFFIFFLREIKNRCEKKCRLVFIFKSVSSPERLDILRVLRECCIRGDPISFAPKLTYK